MIVSPDWAFLVRSSQWTATYRLPREPTGARRHGPLTISRAPTNVTRLISARTGMGPLFMAPYALREAHGEGAHLGAPGVGG